MNSSAPKTSGSSDSEIASAWQIIWRGIRNWFNDLIDLKQGMDREGTIISIKEGKRMRGANAWMLICSIMIASLGLDLDSEAVIIGAMLISPLMSPILGIGLGVSMNDRDILYPAIRNFIISIVIALVVSTVWFYWTPLGSFTGMIESRTAPTILDGLVAIFGGFAGVISITRKDKSNAIPGVAIATALMPPLCVTGYGLAELLSIDASLVNVAELRAEAWDIVWGSFYLFSLNSFFIALTAYIIIRVFLQFDFKQFPNQNEARRAKLATIVVVIIAIIPGINGLGRALNKLNYDRTIREFVAENFPNNCSEYNLLEQSQDTNLLVIRLIRQDVKDGSNVLYTRLLDSIFVARSQEHPPTQVYAVPDFSLRFQNLRQNGINPEQFQQLTTKIQEVSRLQAAISRLDSAMLLRHEQMLSLDSLQLQRMYTTVKQADQFATLNDLSFAQTQRPGQPPLPIFWAQWTNTPGPRQRSRQETALRNFLQQYINTYQLQLDTLVVRSYQ